MTSFRDVRAWLDQLESRAPEHTHDWSAAQALDHCAQSIEYAVTGFPELKPGWFRATIGPLAAIVFVARRKLSHGLADPIPGAPALSDDLAASVHRLRQAMDAFEAAETLHPHFAYGQVNRQNYEILQCLHVAAHAETLQ